MRNWLILLISVFLSACVTMGGSTKDGEVLQINALASSAVNDGGFTGLEFLADPVPGETRNRVNILYLHGIGFTEDRTADALGASFLRGIADAYNLDASDAIVTTLCGEAPIKPSDARKTHIYLNADSPKSFETVLPGSSLRLDRLACMDKQVLTIDDNLEFVLYRVFWDNVFWDALQYPHVGQDDDRGTSAEVAALRHKYNRVLKDDLVNYGFSDAVMYLGEAGGLIRQAVSGAMCAAALDAIGHDFSLLSGGDLSVTTDEACAVAGTKPSTFNRFAFVTESLGSKILFDVMRDVATDNRTTIHDHMIAGSDTYMLANQLALFGLADLGRTRGEPKYIDDQRPSLIALSEVNDLLTYEIVPFIEQLYRNSYNDRGGFVPSHVGDTERSELINALGFDIVDVRLNFAAKVLPILSGFINPKDAHTRHADRPTIMRYILCGAENGELIEEGCLAAGINTP